QRADLALGLDRGVGERADQLRGGNFVVRDPPPIDPLQCLERARRQPGRVSVDFFHSCARGLATKTRIAPSLCRYERVLFEASLGSGQKPSRPNSQDGARACAPGLAIGASSGMMRAV